MNELDARFRIMFRSSKGLFRFKEQLLQLPVTALIKLSAGRWYSSRIVRWTAAEMTNSKPYTVTEDTTRGYAYEDIAEIAHIVVQPDGYRGKPRLVWYDVYRLDSKWIDTMRGVFSICR